jgi:sulfur-carrier protein
MSIKVKFFARLREQVGRPEQDMEFRPGLRVSDVRRETISSVQGNETFLVAVNMEYKREDVELNDGDEVAFFPPVTGG